MNYIDELYKKFAIQVMNTEAISERNGLVLELYEFRKAIKEALEKQRQSDAELCVQAGKDLLAEWILDNKLEDE